MLAFFALLVLGMPSQAQGPADTGVRDASGGGMSAQTEQTLAVDPVNPANVLIGFFGGFVVSHDGGLSWKLSSVSCGNVDDNPVFDRRGRAYLECNSNGVTVWRSTDAGDTWLPQTNPVTNADNNGDFPDRPWLVASPNTDRLVLGWESFFTNPAGWVFVKTTEDGATTWSPARQVDSLTDEAAQADPREQPVVGADGTLYVVYAVGHNPFPAPQAFPTSLVVARSSNGGVSFTRAVAAAGITRTTSPYEEAEAISSLAADPNPRRAGHLALAWADQRSGESRILVALSGNGGRSWGPPVDVADDAPGRGAQHDHAQVRFAPDGRVVVVWRDHRCCATGWSSSYQLWARSLRLVGNGRLVKGRVIQVTSASQASNSSTMYDEYMGLSVGPEGVSVAWNQLRAGVASSTFRRIPLIALGR